MKKTLFLMLTALLLNGPVSGGPLQQSHVPEDALWLMHVDFDALRSSEIGKLMHNEMHSKYKEKIDALAKLLGSDITTGLQAMTLYGAAGGEENAATLIYGDYDKETLQALLVLNNAYSKAEYNGHTIHHWTDENRQEEQYGAFADEDTIVISQTESIVRTALDVLAGRQSSLMSQPDSTLSSLCAERKDTIALVAAEGLSELAEGNEQAAILKNSTLMAALADETGGHLKLDILLGTRDEEAAMQIEQMARGMLAFVGLQARQHPEVGKLLQAISLTRDKSILDCTFSYPSADLFEFFKNQQIMKVDFISPISQKNRAINDNPEQSTGDVPDGI